MIEDEARLVAEVKAEVEAAASDATMIDASSSLEGKVYCIWKRNFV